MFTIPLLSAFGLLFINLPINLTIFGFLGKENELQHINYI